MDNSKVVSAVAAPLPAAVAAAAPSATASVGGSGSGSGGIGGDLLALQTLLGGDSVISERALDGSVYICVHFSNSTETLITQFQALIDILSIYHDKSVYLMGDYNARPFTIPIFDDDVDVSNAAAAAASAATAAFLNSTSATGRNCSGTLLGFYPKNISPEERTLANAIITETFTDRQVLMKDPTAPTTSKMRLITCQTDKMLLLSTDVIDNIIYFSPVFPASESSPQSYISCNATLLSCCTKAFHKVVEGFQICPLEWPSDHYLVDCIFNFVDSNDGNNNSSSSSRSNKMARIEACENKCSSSNNHECSGTSSCTSSSNGGVRDYRKRVMTLNACGESIGGETAFNWAEFASNSFYSAYSTDPAVKLAFEEVINRQRSVCNISLDTPRLFKSLRNCHLTNIHKPPTGAHQSPYLDACLREYFSHCSKLNIQLDGAGDASWDEKDDNLSDESNHIRYILYLYNQIMTHPTLSSLFLRQFDEVAKAVKLPVLEVVKSYIQDALDRTDGCDKDIDAICLQEVGAYIKEAFLNDSNWFSQRGYEIILRKVSAGSKTRGMIISKR